MAHAALRGGREADDGEQEKEQAECVEGRSAPEEGGGRSMDRREEGAQQQGGAGELIGPVGRLFGPAGTSIRVSQLFGFVTAAVAIVLLVVNLGFRNHDPAKLWVNQMKRRARRVALVYPAGVPAAEKWLKAQKKSLEQEFAKTEEYALPKGTPAEEAAELVASLKAREDLSEVRQPKAGR